MGVQKSTSSRARKRELPSRCLTALGLQGKFQQLYQTKYILTGELGSQNQNRKSRNTGASFRFLRASTWSVNLHLSWESPCWATLWPCVKMHLCCLTELFHLQYVPFVLFSIYRFWNLIQRRATSPKTCNGSATTSKIYLCVFEVCIGLFQAFGSNFFGWILSPIWGTIFAPVFRGRQFLSFVAPPKNRGKNDTQNWVQNQNQK